MHGFVGIPFHAWELQMEAPKEWCVESFIETSKSSVLPKWNA